MVWVIISNKQEFEQKVNTFKHWTKLKWDHIGSTSLQIKTESSELVHPVESWIQIGSPRLKKKNTVIMRTSSFFEVS